MKDKASTTVIRGKDEEGYKVEKQPKKENVGDRRRRQSGSTEEEDMVGNTHERVRALRRKERWKTIRVEEKYEEDD